MYKFKISWYKQLFSIVSFSTKKMSPRKGICNWRDIFTVRLIWSLLERSLLCYFLCTRNCYTLECYRSDFRNLRVVTCKSLDSRDATFEIKIRMISSWFWSTKNLGVIFNGSWWGVDKTWEPYSLKGLWQTLAVLQGYLKAHWKNSSDITKRVGRVFVKLEHQTHMKTKNVF